MSSVIPLDIRFRCGFSFGYNAIASAGEDAGSSGFDTGMDFGIMRCAAREEIAETSPLESVWLLMHGEAEIEAAGETRSVSRTHLFDQEATALHVCRDTPIRLRHRTDTEWAVIRTENPNTFPARTFLPGESLPEFRGAGLVQNGCLRNVRLLFDLETRPDSNLVVGEVINLPGRWSSYPPHHHDQPEIYHYRFTEPQGYGHGESGDDVYKLRHGDTLFIEPGKDHGQVSAPGYGMYYLWFIRHLPGNPYNGFSFAPEHEWALNPERQGWHPAAKPPSLE